MYSYYDSVEPESRFYGGDKPSKLGENPGDPAEGALYRTVHVVALNNTIIPRADTVVNVRYGFTSFKDNDVPNQFDPSTLGFSSQFIGLIPRQKFPSLNVEEIGSVNFQTFGDRDPQDTTYYSHSANVSASKLYGRHKVKAGADYRLIGMKNTSFGASSGGFTFNAGFTRGPNPLAAAANTGASFASFLLGYPASGNITVATPNKLYINY